MRQRSARRLNFSSDTDSSSGSESNSENNASKLNVVDNDSAADNDEDEGNATKVSPPRAKEVFMWATPVPVRRIVMAETA